MQTLTFLFAFIAVLALIGYLTPEQVQALNAAISEDGWFDPLIVDTDREPPASEYDPGANDPWVATMVPRKSAIQARRRLKRGSQNQRAASIAGR